VDVRHCRLPSAGPPARRAAHRPFPYHRSSIVSIIAIALLSSITMASDKDTSAKDFYEDEKHLMKLCDFLRSSEGPPVREAIEMDKRVYYIKGAFWRCGLLQRTYFIHRHGSSHQMKLLLSWTISK